MRWRDIGVAGLGQWLAAIAVVLLAGCSAGATPAQTRPAGLTASGTSASAPGQASSPPLGPPTPISTEVVKPPAPPSPSALPVAPGAGQLKQTQTFPSTKSVAFHNAMYDLWLAVTTGKSRYALQAFFPEQAYEQLKAIAYPESDWRYRLWYDFTLDIAAAHAVVGHNARLVRVLVASEYAGWIPPGYCYNSIGYWHAPPARVVYMEDGQERSIGIASLISWRGVWYVVHFGAVLRSSDYGEVDDPTTGPGYTGGPGGC